MTASFCLIGGSGFVGGALSRLLVQRGHQVACPRSAELDLIAPGAARDLGRLVNGDTVLVVLARSRRLPYDLDAFAADIAIAGNVARCLAEYRVGKCVYLSTLSVYGDGQTDLDIRETTPVDPAGLYGAAKYAGERVVEAIAAERAIPALILRPCKIYGPGNASSYGPTSFVAAALAGARLRLYGDGSELRDHIYVDDLAEAVYRLAVGDHRGIFNLASGASRSFADILTIAAGAAGRQPVVDRAERTRAKVDQAVNNDKLLAALPGLTFLALEEGIARACEILRSH